MNTSFDHTLTAKDIAALFGTTLADLPPECLSAIDRSNFKYRILAGNEREAVALDVLKQVDSGKFTLAGKEGKGRWEKGWQENLDAFTKSGGDLDCLVPKYIRPRQPVRLNQNYVLPEDDAFELNWYNVFRTWLFKRHLAGFDAIYEFGCGSGFNLAVLANFFPKTRLFGLDWAKASCEIANKMSELYGWKTEGHHFDFFAPDESFKILPNSAVFTIGALEQTGDNIEPFLQYLLRAKPALCVYIEPICEWYDEGNLVDYAAIRFHRTRNYWMGFPARLEQLEREGKVEILGRKRSYFGSLFLEGYSQIKWRPI